MAVIEVRRAIAAPAQRVLDILLDMDAYPRWVVNTDAVVRSDSNVATPGVTYEERNPFLGPLKVSTRWKVVAANAQEGLMHELLGGVPNLRSLLITMLPTDDGRGGTNYLHRWDFEPALGPPGALLTRLMRPGAERDVGRSADALKALAESP